MMGYFLNGVSGNEWILYISMIPDTALLSALSDGGFGYVDPTGHTNSYDWDGTTAGKDSITLDAFGEAATWYKIGTIPGWFEGVPDGGICRLASGEKELVKSSGTGISFYYFDGSDKNESYFLVVDGGDFSYWWNGATHTGSAPSAGIYASPRCINIETGENIVSLTTFYGHETYKIDPSFLPEISSGGTEITKTSQLENDSGFITLADLPVYGGEMENG